MSSARQTAGERARRTQTSDLLQVALPIFAQIFTPGGGRTVEYCAEQAIDAAEALLAALRQREERTQDHAA